MFGGAYSGRRVLLTGQTGFKGAWIAHWLLALGADVRGYALAPQADQPLHAWLGLPQRLRSEFADVRDRAAVRAAVREFRPEIVLHLAAQPLVRLSYSIPVETMETNVMGTAHLLDAVRVEAPEATVVVVTSDKCYENHERSAGYREDEPMGGHDPYSASKGMTEILVASWRRSYLPAQGPGAWLPGVLAMSSGAAIFRRIELFPTAFGRWRQGPPQSSVIGVPRDHGSMCSSRSPAISGWAPACVSRAWPVSPPACGRVLTSAHAANPLALSETWSTP